MQVLPNSTQRLVIVGRTGSGKTQAGAFYLSRADFGRMPWVIVNSKGDELLNEIDTTEIDFGNVPKRPGLYTLRPLPHENDDFNAFLWKVHSKGYCGLYFDEGYMIPSGSDSFRAILTQGRSKRIPVITLSQRPVYMDRFVWSEAEFINIFRLQNWQDLKTAQEMVEVDLRPVFGAEGLPQYWSIWRDVVNDRLTAVKPVPTQDEILSAFNERTRTRRVYL